MGAARSAHGVLHEAEEITAPYVRSPERWLGSQSIATASDVWSLGAVCVALALGHCSLIELVEGSDIVEFFAYWAFLLGPPAAAAALQALPKWTELDPLLSLASWHAEPSLPGSAPEAPWFLQNLQKLKPFQGGPVPAAVELGLQCLKWDVEARPSSIELAAMSSALPRPKAARPFYVCMYVYE